MEPTTLHTTKTSAPGEAAEPARKSAAGQSANEPPVEPPVEPPPGLDRRGKPLPPRQRVGGIITPQ
jgi:hypothetical protein